MQEVAGSNPAESIYLSAAISDRMGKKFAIGLFIGRFQPFHKGHLFALRYAESRCKRLIIGIGSSNQSGTERDPISAAGRIRIIKAALGPQEIDRRKISFMRIMQIPDFNDNDVWFRYIMSREPDIEVVFSRHWLVKKIFREHGIKVIMPEWHKRGTFAAVRIRKMVRDGRRWEQRVPEGAVREIEKHTWIEGFT